MSKPLLLTPSPKPDESFLGYLLRLTEVNGYETVTVIINLAGLSSATTRNASRVREDSLDLRSLAALTGVAPEVLRQLPLRRTSRPGSGDGYELANGWLPAHCVPAVAAKVCSMCLCEAPYLRRSWDLLPITACVRHALLLVDRCEGCHKLIPSRRGKVCRCRCGYDWRHTPTTSVDGAELKASRYFERLLGLTTPIDALPETCGNPLFERPPFTFLSNLYFIIAHWEPDARRLGMRHARSFSNAHVHRLLCRALKVFDDWPTNLHVFLSEERARSKSATSKGVGLRHEFPHFMQLFHNGQVAVELDLLREGFGDYVETKWAGAQFSSRPRATRQIRTDNRYITYELAKEQMSSPGILDHFIKTGRIHHVAQTTSGGRKMLLLDRVDVLTAKAERQKLTVLHHVPKRLGVCCGAVMTLVEGDLLHVADSPYGKSRRVFFKNAEIDDLIVKLEAKILPSPKLGEEVWTQLKLAQHLGLCGMSITTMVQAMLDGQLPIRGRTDAPGIKGFLFSGPEAHSWLQQQREQRDEAIGMYPLDRAATRLGMSLNTLSWLVKQKILPATVRPGAGKVTVVVKECDLNHFERTYVTAGQLAFPIQSRARKVIQVLKQANIIPLTAPPTAGAGWRMIFRRTDVAGLDLPDMILKAPKLPRRSKGGSK